MVAIGIEAGLQEKEIRDMLDSDSFKKEVAADVAEANKLKIDTVPTFLFERKYAIIGSEPITSFLETLREAYDSWKSESSNDEIDITKGKSCTIDGVCDI